MGSAGVAGAGLSLCTRRVAADHSATVRLENKAPEATAADRYRNCRTGLAGGWSRDGYHLRRLAAMRWAGAAPCHATVAAAVANERRPEQQR